MIYTWTQNSNFLPTFFPEHKLTEQINPLTVELKAKLQQIPHRCVDMCTYRTNQMALIYLHVRAFIIDWNVMGILFSLHFFKSSECWELASFLNDSQHLFMSYQSCFSYLKKKALIFQLTASGSTLNSKQQDKPKQTNLPKLHSSQFPHLSQIFSVSCWLSGDLVYAVWLQLFCTPGISSLICQVHAQAFLYQLYQ